MILTAIRIIGHNVGQIVPICHVGNMLAVNLVYPLKVDGSYPMSYHGCRRSAQNCSNWQRLRSESGAIVESGAIHLAPED